MAERDESGKVLIATARLRVPLKEFDFSYARSSGAGGQNVNKVSSKAVLRWNPGVSPSLPPDVRERFMEKFATRLTSDGELVLASDRFRDQGRNVEDCFDKLVEMLKSVAFAPKARKKTKPTRSSQRRRLDSKRKHSDKKQSRRGSFD